MNLDQAKEAFCDWWETMMLMSTKYGNPYESGLEAEKLPEFGLLVDHLKRFIDYEAVPRDPAQEPHHDEDLRRRQEDEALPVLVEAPMFFSNYFSQALGYFLANFARPVLGGIDVQKFASKSSRSTRFTHFCTAPPSTIFG